MELLLSDLSLRFELLLLELDDVTLEAVRRLPQFGVVHLELVVVLLHQADLLLLEAKLRLDFRVFILEHAFEALNHLVELLCAVSLYQLGPRTLEGVFTLAHEVELLLLALD